MKRYLISASHRFILLFFFLLPLMFLSAGKVTDSEFYQLTVYHYKTATQENTIDNYLKNALLPTLHRLHVNNIGVFKSLANDTSADKLIYVLVTIKSLDEFTKLAAKLDADATYQKAGSDYINAQYTEPAYTRKETIVLHAFPLAPQMQLPVLKSAFANRVYELRSYESASEEIFQNKVKMFNEGGEIYLFKRLNFNGIFYSEVIAGGKMPNLMYMTSFENMADRDAHWKAFVDDPFWKKLSAMPEYQNNVSKIDIVFLHPASYSDF